MVGSNSHCLTRWNSLRGSGLHGRLEAAAGALPQLHYTLPSRPRPRRPVFLNGPTFILNAPSAQWGAPLHAACCRTHMRAQAPLDSATLRDTD